MKHLFRLLFTMLLISATRINAQSQTIVITSQYGDSPKFTVSDTWYALSIRITEDGKTVDRNAIIANTTLTSSDTDVADVRVGDTYPPCMILLKKAGSAEITITYKGTSKKITATIHEMDFSLNPNPITVAEGETATARIENVVVNGQPVASDGYTKTLSSSSIAAPYYSYKPGEDNDIVSVTGKKAIVAGSDIPGVRVSILPSGYINPLAKELKVDVVAAPADPIYLAVKLSGGAINIPDPSGITLQLTADKDYKLHSLSLGTEDVTDQIGTDGSYTVPALEETTGLTAVFEHDPASEISQATADNRQMKILVSGHHVSITGASDGATVSVYDPSGKLVKQSRLHEFELDAPSAVYLLTVDGRTFKFAI